MAEGRFDYMEMDDYDEVNVVSDYDSTKLKSEYVDYNKARDRLLGDYRVGDMPDDVRVKYNKIKDRILLIESELERRQKTLGEQESSFIDDGDGKTVTITRGGRKIKAPSLTYSEALDDVPPPPEKSFAPNFKRATTNYEKKQYLREILGAEIKVGDGPYSKSLLKRIKIDPNDNNAKFDGVRIFVKGRGGKSRLIKNKDMKKVVDEFETLLRNSESERGLPMVDLSPPRSTIHGLSAKENSEMRGVLTPTASTECSSRIGDSGSLQIQVDHLQRTINDTVDIINRGDLGSEQN